MRHTVPLSLAVLFLAGACANKTPAPSTAPATAAASAARPDWAPDVALDPATTVASINGVPITAAELDQAVKTRLKSATQEYVEKVYEARSETLQGLVIDRMLETEAQARGITPEELVRQEIEGKAPAPSEEELQSAYDRFVRGRADLSFEDAKPQLVQALSREKQSVRAQAFFEELKDKYKVKTSLPLPKVRRVEVAATGASFGPKDAKVTIVAFSDFECPFCSRVNPTLDRVKQEYGDKVRIVFRHYPLPFHPNAPKASEASLCADDQGKFWAMHDKLFENQQALGIDDLKSYASAIGLDQAKFDACLDSGEKGAIVQRDLEEGQAAGVNGTPAFFINGRLLSGAQPFEQFKTVIDAELGGA